MNDKVLINGKEYPVKFGHLAYSFYLKNNRKLTEADQADNMYYLHYSALAAGAKRAGQEIDITFDEFMIALDDNPELFPSLIALQKDDQEPKK